MTLTTGLILSLISFVSGFALALAARSLARYSDWEQGYYTGWEARKDYEAAARDLGHAAVAVRTGGHFHWAGWEGPCTPD